MVRGDHRVELPTDRTDEHRVRGYRAGHADAFRAQDAEGRLEDAGLFVSEEPAVGRVRVHRTERDPRAVQATGRAQATVGEAGLLDHTFDREHHGHIRQTNVRGCQYD